MGEVEARVKVVVISHGMNAAASFLCMFETGKKGICEGRWGGGGGNVLRLRLANPMLKLRAIATLMFWGM